MLNKKKTHQQEFQDRFKGKTTLISKDGHIGVVTNTQKPINKNGLNEPILKRSETMDESTSSGKLGLARVS